MFVVGIEIGKGRKLKEGKDIAVITLGPIGVQAEKAVTHAEQETGKSIAHYDSVSYTHLDVYKRQTEPCWTN